MKKALIFLIIGLFSFTGSSQRLPERPKIKHVIIIRVFDDVGNIIIQREYI